MCESIQAMISFLLGVVVYPWHNLPNTSEQIQSIGIDSMLSLIKKKKPLVRKDGDSLVKQFKQNSSYLKSPVFLGSISQTIIDSNLLFYNSNVTLSKA